MTDDAAVRERIRNVLQAGGGEDDVVLELDEVPGEYRVWAQTADRMSAATQLLPVAGALTRRGYEVSGQRAGDRAWLRVRPPR